MQPLNFCIHFAGFNPVLTNVQLVMLNNMRLADGYAADYRMA